MAVPGSINRTVSRRAVLGIAAAGVLAAACARAPRSAGEQVGQGREPVTLRLTWVAKEFEHTYQVMGPVFEQRYPWVKLQLEASPDYLEKLTVLFATNTIGDVMFLESDDEAFFAYWAAAGMLRQLDDYIKRDKYDLNVFFLEAIRALRSVDGNMWAFPYKAFMARCGLFFNIDLLEQGGMRLPTDDWTYDDLAQAAQKLTRRSGGEVEIWGSGRKMGGGLAFTAVMRAFGGDLYTPDGKRTLVGQPRSPEAINWWLDRYLNEGTILPDLAANSFTLFQQGKVALLAGRNPGDRVTFANALNPNNVRWGLVLMPKGPAGRRGGSFFLYHTHRHRQDQQAPRGGVGVPEVPGRERDRRGDGLPHPAEWPDLLALRRTQGCLHRSTRPERAGHAAGRDAGAGSLDGAAGAAALAAQLPRRRGGEGAQRGGAQGGARRGEGKRWLLPEPGAVDPERAGSAAPDAAVDCQRGRRAFRTASLWCYNAAAELNSMR